MALDRDLDHQVTSATSSLLTLTLGSNGLAVFNTGWDAHLVDGPITCGRLGGGTPNGISEANSHGTFDIGALRRTLLEATLAATKTTEDITEASLTSCACLTKKPGEDIFRNHPAPNLVQHQ